MNAALDAGINFFDAANVYGELRKAVGQRKSLDGTGLRSVRSNRVEKQRSQLDNGKGYENNTLL
ncbi:hypothetical protein [Paenibacillus sp. 19GGS1-52]|uniref:hypothetical protein n=1 Tax=Paenibacillus sp. 19GGS1-52 TaxID=2758563 RepID=UPI001EFABB5B|nr:hypothetical protein [Paenibacillus sp. 19GGS1-52]